MLIRLAISLCLVLLATATLAIAAPKNFGGTFTNSEDPNLPVDFNYQGEYAGAGLGAQVIALDKGAFQAVLYPGGLPGAGWDGKNKILLEGKLEGKSVILNTAKGKKRYLGNSPAEFSATRDFPPQGHKEYSGVISGDELAGKTEKGKGFSLTKINRASPTMGKNSPKGAIVLFDGSSKEEWQGGRVDEKTKLLNTDGSDIRTKRKFNDYLMHIEFLLPYRPAARGQGRGNSGFYQVDHYEMQILDSFGLEGLNNECGGIYSKKASDVNGCFPPLSWQTYDVDFKNARSKDGKKTANAILTARLNGILIHNGYEIPGKTGGSRNDPEGTSGPIKLQGHGNPLQFRNIWILEK
jgi:hypothetical protein